MIFSGNRTSLYEYDVDEVVADTDYFGEDGAQQIIAESYVNDFALFEGMLMCDFQELALGENATEIELLQEATFANMKAKISENITKAWKKIKGLFETFINKVKALITRDTAKLVNNFSKEVDGKDLSKMEFTYSKPKNSVGDVKIGEMQKASEVMVKRLQDAGSSKENVDKIKSEITDEKYIDTLYGTLINNSNTTESNFKKDLHYFLYESERHFTGISDSDLSDIKNTLTKAEKTLDGIKKTKKSLDEHFSKLKKNVDTFGSKSEDKNKEEARTSALSVLSMYCSKMNRVASRASSALMNETKFGIKQARAIFSKAISYRPVEESYIFEEAVMEASDHDVDTFFESYEF